jgi:hypothetical protein
MDREPIFQPGGLAFLITYIIVGMSVMMLFLTLKGWLLQ